MRRIWSPSSIHRYRTINSFYFLNRFHRAVCSKAASVAHTLNTNLIPFFLLVHVSRSIDLRIVRCVVTSAHTFNKFSIRRSFVALRRYLRNAITKHVIICSIKTYTLRVYGAFIYFIYLWMLSQHQITCNHNHTSVRFEIEYGMNRTNVGGVK